MFTSFRQIAASQTSNGGERAGADYCPGKAARQREGDPASSGRRDAESPEVANSSHVLFVKVTKMRSRLPGLICNC